MALTYSTPTTLGAPAPDFKLVGVDDAQYTLARFRDSRALVVVFMCNHCPYVIAVQDRINQLAREYGAKGVSVVGINSNDVVAYPDDNFEKMKARSKEEGFVFPYLFDETQAVARAYDAACTPDPYVYENTGGKFLLRYHGRIDDNWKEPVQVQRRELAEALDAILSGHPVQTDQKPSMGCNIKWRNSRS
jgi:peroxiredoxin